MSFIIVIPVFNEVLLLPELLNDIARQTLKPEKIIVADCGSIDGTLEMLAKKYPTVFVAHSQQKSPAGARNAGSKVVMTKQIVFVDADICIPNEFFDQMLSSHLQTDADVTYPKFVSDGKSVMGAIHAGYVRFWLWFWRIMKPEKRIGGVICINRNVFEALGGFNDSLVKGEDVELYMAASRAGYKINCCRTVQCFVSSRRTRGFGIVKTFLADGPLFSKIRRNKRDYESYK